ncbi:hypothetical protein O6H91_09G036700 [Diphasiastrum complanatum]|uniref:Uncharacterized protein n=1 Tax=Diphasiastrum complanatum TaxID=34168 RepID=A0ACC2CMZ7_DIPCM|nr:hypothetical protein O6H91_09G036700 [Diphasiastrum complanatum]
MGDQAHMQQRARLVKEQAQEALHKLQKCAPRLVSNDRWNTAALALVVALVSVGLAFTAPVLIPLGGVLFLVAAGVLLAVALLLGISSLYKYVNGTPPPWADQIDAARSN